MPSKPELTDMGRSQVLGDGAHKLVPACVDSAFAECVTSPTSVVVLWYCSFLSRRDALV
jgi:hypothetical protein